MKRTYLMAAVALVASALVVNAQDAQRPRRGGGGGGNSLFAALDTNKDGVLDADEIAKAPEALKKLDKNGDGKITRDELRPAGAAAADTTGKGKKKKTADAAK
jgi:hypothetical protein